ncbi:hypothetical protein [Streptomyces rubradiris]|uniref:Secreted protein n=1 Tax=Streptomyces rubradiris TaxID=285531 RepID=A0ABQ3RPN6_STRRR|nr:hypothetical protein [Streptomyces rubradiris]GHH18126.1 hypothetical protein GCM10018792_49640 [Streptomyces rubradiris]GHI57841.1 hypothetical protein Srubr_76870 [Streptomyces rubradiris]
MATSRFLTIATLSTALIFGATTAASAGTGGTTSTKLSNGKLKFEARNGSVVSGNSSVFYGATEYEKSGGSKVYVTLMMVTSEALFRDSQKAVSAGQKVSHSFGAQSIAKYAPDCSATGLMDATTGKYYTPPVTFC